MSFDWNNAAEQYTAAVLGLVPEVGPLLAGFVYIFWPQDQVNVWAEVQAQVEQLIDQKLGAYEQEQVNNDLIGLQNALNDYLDALATGDKPQISSQWITTSTIFDTYLPNFQSPSYQLLLLPLFAQFVNMNLGLLRDGVLGGSSWGWNEAYLQSVQTKLTTKINTFTQYATATYQTGLTNVKNNTGSNNHQCQPFRSVNAFIRQMTVTVVDFVDTWQYFNVMQYPQPVQVLLPREIYSDPMGTCDNSGNIVLPAAPTQPISQISVWAWDRIDAVQLTYPQGGGPGGVTQTARMGDSNGGSNQPPHGGTPNVAQNPVTVAAGLAGSILNGFSFTFQNGTTTAYGNNYPGGSPFSFSYSGEVLSSIHINGVSNFYGSADCAVFGFQYPGGVVPATNVANIRVITRLPKAAVATDLSADLISANEAEHAKFWQSVSAKAAQNKK